ncbi:hypothetical protein DRN86_02990 [Candidatus Geothermarchaeota archaeon]|nr:MAG: hypothetical protein DRN86_02990 [Candidatus Geothermarchaeota archaeon]
MNSKGLFRSIYIEDAKIEVGGFVENYEELTEAIIGCDAVKDTEPYLDFCFRGLRIKRCR